MANEDEKKASSTEPQQQLAEKLAQLFKNAKKSGITDEEVRYVMMENVKNPALLTKAGLKDEKPVKRSRLRVLMIFLVAAIPVIVGSQLAYYRSLDPEGFAELLNPKCLLENNMLVAEAARPIVNCKMCKGVKEIPHLSKITREEFSKYAYTGLPVIVSDALQNWTARETFNFSFFKNLYSKHENVWEMQERECQFFPYNTEFDTLEEALMDMTEARANLEEGQRKWYFGWSNCHPDIMDELRRHYERPYFLPADSESSNIDWIFMGGAGEGANIHLDYVQRPSWQAQIKGKKTWQVIPVPECDDVCSSFNTTVHPGEIIIIDTNRWYHSTFIHPGEISITIGSEYD